MSTRNIELPLGKTRIKANGIPPRITYIHDDDSVLLGQVFVGDYVRSLLSPTVQVINIQDTPTLTFYLSRLKNVPRTLVVSSRKPTTTSSGNCRIDISLPAGHVGLTFERRQSDNSVIVRRVAHDSPIKKFVEPQSVVYGVKLSTHQSVVFSNGSAHEIARSIGEHRHLSTRVLMLSSIPAMMDRRQADPSASIRTTTTDRQAAAHDILFEPSVMMMAEDNARRRDVDDERSLVSATVILEDQSVSAEDPSTLANWPDNNDDSRRVQAAVPLEHSARRCRRGADDNDEETLSLVAFPVRSSFVRDEPLAAVVLVPPFLNDRQDASVSPQRRGQSNPYDDVDTISPVAVPVTPSDGSSDVNHRAPMATAAIPTSPSVSGSSISEGGTTSCSTEITIKGGTGEAQHIHIKLKPNEHVFANPDCLVYMTNGIRIEESESDPTVLRRFVYANDDACDEGTLVLGSSTPCKMFSVRLESQGRQLICQRGAVVCCDSSVECTMLEDGGREDLLRLSGGGCVYLRAAGSVLQRRLEVLEVLECSPGALLAFENTVAICNASLSGTRLVMVQVRGPGMVWMSTSPTSCSSSL